MREKKELLHRVCDPFYGFSHGVGHPTKGAADDQAFPCLRAGFSARFLVPPLSSAPARSDGELCVLTPYYLLAAESI